MTRPNLLGLRSALFAASAASLVLSAASPAVADDATETVVVTGSRIPVTNATNPSPVSVVTEAQIKMTSAFSLEDVLTKMTGPDATAGLTNSSNNGGVGLSEIGLRNLGPTRTLVLVDGERLVPIYSSSSSVPDLNSVPISMVDRVEVLRDGASSIYGADAIGGVINVITKKDFEGFQIDAHGGVSQHGGGDTYGVTGTLGVNMDRGNVTFAVLNEHLAALSQADRSWAQDPHIGDPNFEGGSIYRGQLNIMQDENSTTVWANGVETDYTNPALGSIPCLTYLPGLGRVKLNAGCPGLPGGEQTLTSGLGRTQISVNGHYDITSNIKFVGQAFFTRRDSLQRLRPEPLLGDSIASTNPTTGVPVFGGFMVPVSWPGYSDPNVTASVVPFDATNGTGCKDPAGCILGFLTPNEFGPRTYKQVSDTYRVRAGFEGTIFNDYHWDVGYVLQRNDSTQRTENSGNWLHLAEATGQIPCVDAPGGCTFSPTFGYAIPTTPINFFNGNGVDGLTPEQVKYLTYTMIDTNNSYENYGYINLNGPIFDLPAGKVEGALGFERRFEHLTDNPDSLVQMGYAANPAGPTSGGYGVTSVSGELSIPLLKDMPMAQYLTLNPSARYDHYSTFGDAKTWKIGADWQVIDDLRFRATYATGFRAPSVAELFGGQGISYVSVHGDPCDSRGVGFNGNASAGKGSLAPGSACYNQLTAQGLSPAQIAAYQSPENNLSNDQRGLIIGGNPALEPETSRSWNLGAVVTPTFLPGSSFDIDYYEVKIKNAILTGGIAQNSGPDVVTLGCYVDQNPDYCSQITRNASGIFQIGSLNTNFGAAQVKGLDMQLTYSTEAGGIELPWESSAVFNVEINRQFTNTTQNLDLSTNHFAGYFLYSNESIQPNWKGRMSIDWTICCMQLHYDLQYIGHLHNYDGGGDIYGNYIPAYWYHNISAAFSLEDMIGQPDLVKGMQLIVGINNLADKDPPFLGSDSICKCNSLAGPYDFVGRFFYTRVSVKT